LKLKETNTKDEELKKYRALVLAAVDHQIELLQSQPIQVFDPAPGLQKAKIQVEEHFSKGRLSILKSWYRDMTESIREGRQFKFNSFVKERTGYSIDIFKEHFDRAEKVIAKGKITTDNQFYDINSMIDYLCQVEPVDKQKIDVLNSLLLAYEQRKSKSK
jgi:hypothetical protein